MSDQNNPSRPYNWDGSEGEFISRTAAKASVKSYRNSKAYVEMGKCYGQFLGKEKIIALLDAPGAVGIRVYYAKATKADSKRKVKKGDAQIVAVPVDRSGNNIFTLGTKNSKGGSALLNLTWPCPVWCPNDDI